MGLVSNIDFLKSASELFEKAQERNSSIYITQKRLIQQDDVNGNEDNRNEVSKFKTNISLLPHSKIIANSQESYSILIRITDGNSDKSKKTKYSTVVKPEDLSKFWKEYSSVIKSGAKGLKKKDKNKKKKKVTK
ncbi:hypothetical protein WICMUC_005375 [Wickerhamomyces mucosus]|uniref:Signal recognition particle subunit SRP14 n=1 Tax=Wickerhamomyces mucosus TaxID=1378264 RepID=A0A9P8P747_9ASCO|nr:hypothetical protein WICMUC_005375 [Wickerhamomyces mucosus]